MSSPFVSKVIAIFWVGCVLRLVGKWKQYKRKRNVLPSDIPSLLRKSLFREILRTLETARSNPDYWNLEAIVWLIACARIADRSDSRVFGYDDLNSNAEEV